MLAKFAYVSPLTVILNWPLEAWVDIQNVGDITAECPVIFGMREYHAGHDIWSGWGEWPPIIVVLEPGEIHRFSLSTEYSTPLSQQIKVKSLAGTLLQPPAPKEFLCVYCWAERHLSFDTQAELDAHIASEHPEVL
ncbi:hypothetical protein ES703_17410 [subsurface metagenome]